MRLACLFQFAFRLDVGGKLLTNQLKELVSFRQWNMMDETYIMNHVKESCCFISTDFKKDLEMCRYVSVLFAMSKYGPYIPRPGKSKRRPQGQPYRPRLHIA
jgi:hypothetical protein